MPAPASDIPLARIEDMQRKGLTNNQIIQTLQRDGYTTTQVFDALNQANMQPTHQMRDVTMDQRPTRPSYQNPTTMGSGLPGDPSGMPPPPSLNAPMMGGMGGGASSEELIEAIIDEKWHELEKSVNKIIEWKDAMNARIEKLEQRMDDLKGDSEKLHDAVVGKIGEYDRNILEVGAEVKAMEKVFSKVLPVFTENVAELSRITDKVRSPSSVVKK